MTTLLISLLFVVITFLKVTGIFAISSWNLLGVFLLMIGSRLADVWFDMTVYKRR